MLLDTWKQLFIWVGANANKIEKVSQKMEFNKNGGQKINSNPKVLVGHISDGMTNFLQLSRVESNKKRISSLFISIASVQITTRSEGYPY